MAKRGIDIKPETVLILGAGIAGLILVRRIMVNFGLAKGAGERRAEQAQEDPGSPWKGAFWKRGGTGTLLLTVAQADNYSTKIYEALNWYSDDEDTVIGIFNSLKTKSQVSWLAEKFFIKYNKDLLQWLKEGSDLFPWNGLGSDELQRILNIVDKLPNYRPR